MSFFRSWFFVPSAWFFVLGSRGRLEGSRGAEEITDFGFQISKIDTAQFLVK